MWAALVLFECIDIGILVAGIEIVLIVLIRHDLLLDVDYFYWYTTGEYSKWSISAFVCPSCLL